MAKSNYENIHIVFAKDSEEEMKLYNTIKEYCFKNKILVSVYIKKLAEKNLKLKNYLK